MPATAAPTHTSSARAAARRRRGNSPGGGARRRPTNTQSRPTHLLDSSQLCLLSALEMRKLTIALTPVEDLCSWCLAHGPKGCPACTQRRRKAVRLADAGKTVAQIAEEMELSEARVERLLEQDRDRRTVAQYAVGKVPNAAIRAAFERRKRQDPDFSAAKLARNAGFSCSSHVERELGVISTSDTTKNGKTYAGEVKTHISAENAERLLRGLGYGPNDIERVIAGEEL